MHLNLTGHPTLDLIKTAVEKSAAEARYNAGMDGAMHDGGEGEMRRQLEYWLDGVNFALTGSTAKYSHIVKQAQREADPDYQKYIELKARFG